MTCIADKPAEVFILGCGSVGTALGLALARAGVKLVGAQCRTEASAARASELLGLDVGHGDIPEEVSLADTIIVAVPDPLIRPVSEELADSRRTLPGQVALHCSGSRSADDLAPLRGALRGLGSFHPLLSFADPATASELLPAAAFAIEGDDPACRRARGLAAALGGLVLEIPARDRVLYHAAAATASNHLVALAAQSAACLSQIGVAPDQAVRALVPLMRSTLNNLDRLGLPDALTGPVSRGDAAAVRAHLAAIDERAPEELGYYRVMALRALEVARAQGKAPAPDLDLVEAELGGVREVPDSFREEKP